MKRLTMHWVGPLLVALAACGGAGGTAESKGEEATQAAPTALDVNDVSFLYPTPKNAAQAALMTRAETAADDGTPLFPKPLFEQIRKIHDQSAEGTTFPMVLFEDSGTAVKKTPLRAAAPDIDLSAVGGLDLAAWNWVGVRFTACGVAAPGIPCAPSIRVTLQPLVPGTATTPPTLGDSAIHLVYELPEAKAAEVARGLLAIKRPLTTGKPLGPHPVLVAEGFSSNVNKGVVALVKKTLSGGPRPNGYLKHFAMLGLHRSTFAWSFFGGFVVPEGFVFFAQDFGPGGKTAAQDIVFGGDSPGLVGNSYADRPSTHELFAGLRGASTKDYDAIATIENPTKAFLLPTRQTDVRHTDCVSCHSTTGRLLAAGGQFDSGQPKFTRFLQAQDRFRAPKGLTAFAAPEALQNSDYSFHNFGYFENQASVSLRTVNETALEADAFNRKYLRAPNPGPTCDEALVWRCVLEAKQDCFSAPLCRAR